MCCKGGRYNDALHLRARPDYELGIICIIWFLSQEHSLLGGDLDSCDLLNLARSSAADADIVSPSGWTDQ